VLNEVGKRGFAEANHKIKGLVTDGKLDVEVKNGKTTKIDSYHRFILTAQVQDGEAIPTSKDERRYFIVRSSDELCEGAAAEHAAWAELIKRPTARRDFYDFLMSRNLASPVIDKDAIKAAMPPHHRELNAANRDQIDCFVAALADGEDTVNVWGDVVDEGGKLYLSNDDLFARFTEFCRAERVEGGFTKQGFTTRLGQRFKDDPSVEKCDPTWDPAAGKMVRGWKFHLETLREADAESNELDEDRETFDDTDYYNMARGFLVPTP
jgi:hypothetical protein